MCEKSRDCVCAACTAERPHGRTFDPKCPHGHIVDGYKARVLTPEFTHIVAVMVKHHNGDDLCWFNVASGVMHYRSLDGRVYGPIADAPAPTVRVEYHKVVNYHQNGQAFMWDTWAGANAAKRYTTNRVIDQREVSHAAVYQPKG